MEVEYNFVAYDHPKKAVFHVTTDEYRLPGGWVEREEESLIIGEADDLFVTRLSPLSYGEWVGDNVVQRNYILPIGYHKSRFVRWVSTQLTLFK